MKRGGVKKRSYQVEHNSKQNMGRKSEKKTLGVGVKWGRRKGNAKC